MRDVDRSLFVTGSLVCCVTVLGTASESLPWPMVQRAALIPIALCWCILIFGRSRQAGLSYLEAALNLFANACVWGYCLSTFGKVLGLVVGALFTTFSQIPLMVRRRFR